jgi:hypothetical protein
MKFAVPRVTVFPGWESLEGNGRLRTSKGLSKPRLSSNVTDVSKKIFSRETPMISRADISVGSDVGQSPPSPATRQAKPKA